MNPAKNSDVWAGPFFTLIAIFVGYRSFNYPSSQSTQ